MGTACKERKKIYILMNNRIEYLCRRSCSRSKLLIGSFSVHGYVVWPSITIAADERDDINARRISSALETARFRALREQLVLGDGRAGGRRCSGRAPHRLGLSQSLVEALR